MRVCSCEEACATGKGLPRIAMRGAVMAYMLTLPNGALPSEAPSRTVFSFVRSFRIYIVLTDTYAKPSHSYGANRRL
jgi:hypothetical protein